MVKEIYSVESECSIDLLECREHTKSNGVKKAFWKVSFSQFSLYFVVLCGKKKWFVTESSQYKESAPMI